MLTMDDPTPDVYGRGDDLRRAEPLQSEHGANDVYDRIEGTDLVEMNPLDRHVVNRRLGIGQTAKEVDRAVLSIPRETGLLDGGGDLFQAVVIMARRSALVPRRSSGRP